MITIVLAVAAAGGIGAGCRFLVDSLIRQRWSVPFPVGTLVINLTGSLLLGVLAGWATTTLPAVVQAIAGTGFLGGYTTFSTASVETARLLQQRRYASALVNGLGSMIATALLAWIGLLVGRAFG